MGDSYSTWAARLRVPLGFGLAAAYLVFSQPTLLRLETGSVVAFAGVLVRAWAAGHLDKNRSLATGGPYAYTRNPLYLGSFLIGAGFSVAGGSWMLTAAFLCLFALVFWPVLRREEDFLRREFGEAYDHYSAHVPRLLPIPVAGESVRSGDQRFVWRRYRENREYEAAAGTIAGVVFLALKLALR